MTMFRNIMLRHLNIRVLCFMWRMTYSGEFLAVVQSLKSVICEKKFNSTVCAHLHDDPTSEHSVYVTLTDWQTVTMLVWMLPSFAIIPLIAVYLQRGSKKRAIIIMAFLQMLSSVVYMLNAIYPREMYVSGYVVAAALHALYGFAHGFRLIAYAYLADVVATYTPERRSAEMIIQSSFRALGAICSPYLMGYLLKNFGAQYAFMVTSIFDGLMLLYCFLLVDVEPSKDGDSLAAETEPLQEGEAKRNKGVKAFFAPLAHAKGPILRVVIVYAIMETLNIATFNFLPIYVTHSPYSFSSVDLGLYQTIQYAMGFFGALGVSQLFTRIVGKQDLGLVMACILARLFMFSVIMAASSKVLLYVALLSETLNYMYVGSLFSYATEITGKRSFVPLFTLMSQAALLCCAITYPLLNLVFKNTANRDPKIVFVLLLSLAGVAFVVWFWHMCMQARDSSANAHASTKLPMAVRSNSSTHYGAVDIKNSEQVKITRAALA